MAGKGFVSCRRPGDTDDVLRSDVPHPAPCEQGVWGRLRTARKRVPRGEGTRSGPLSAARGQQSVPPPSPGRLSAEGALGHTRQPARPKPGEEEPGVPAGWAVTAPPSRQETPPGGLWPHHRVGRRRRPGLGVRSPTEQRPPAALQVLTRHPGSCPGSAQWEGELHANLIIAFSAERDRPPGSLLLPHLEESLLTAGIRLVSYGLWAASSHAGRLCAHGTAPPERRRHLCVSLGLERAFPSVNKTSVPCAAR